MRKVARMEIRKKKAFAFMALLLMPGGMLMAQSLGNETSGLQAVLENLYREMIPLASGLTSVGRAIAGVAALLYISSRVWKHIANAEAVEFYPLLRPFGIGLAILFFPTLLNIMNGILDPITQVTGILTRDSHAAIQLMLDEKQKALESGKYAEVFAVSPESLGNAELWLKYEDPDRVPGESLAADSVNASKFLSQLLVFNMQQYVKRILSEILQLLYQAAALAINTIRIFYLIVLGILGPIVLGLAVFDGFQHTLYTWFARYINVFMWLPIANIFGAIIAKIQENMLLMDMDQIAASGRTYFSSTDIAYLVFLIIAIIGYFTVPSVANYIVSVGGRDTLLHRSSNLLTSSPAMAAKYMRFNSSSSL
ncbi:Conjugative transposon protein TraJ [Indibacter alkaliphilus LW1]|uniref:Conjugative transposon protein TraJ n=1 Tax=Indibacter alkaliphilus (strain CCUG 57479 / KCTC 22604 / LW1) TaxID=1189612 RepID=S2DIQ6_INDAL|nr:conjugative transposon protein TraJ [Indibacter alkaliphilus]EOZ98929.1 Conjugative transposon protein TraJ [Indibacter alkaliphilus LW1]